MDLRQLEYFQAVSRLKKITLAAEYLHVSQPSISVAIQKLEEELGVPLFNRNQKQLSLTSEGHIFLQRTDHILSSIQNAVLEMNDLKNVAKGTIKIGIPPIIGALLFPPIFTSFKKHYPLIELSIVEQGAVTIKNLLEEGELDLAILETSHLLSDLNSLPIITGKLLVCLPPHHPLSSLSIIPFSNLCNEEFILFPEGTHHRQIILNECARNNFSPHINLTTSQVETIRRLVSKGAGISFLFDALVGESDNIVARPLSDPIHLTYGLGWKKGKYLSLAAKTFIEFFTNSDTYSIL
jgi:DNA-binding transcriptional LysR family regulator